MRAMQRKILFVLFAEDVCRQLHTLMYASDLHRKGYQTKVIIEGMATRLLADLDKAPPRLQKAVADAQAAGLIAGACLQASTGCGSAEDRNVVDAIRAQGVGFLSDLENHAGIEPFLREGYEVIAI
jgi:predicted peroxiredoxin